METLLKTLLNRAKELDIEILPFEISRLSDAIGKCAIPTQVISGMNKEELNKYRKALWDSENEWAKGPGGDGWSDAHDLLKELGFAEQVREEGHRRFISLKYVGQWSCGKCDQERLGLLEKGAEPIPRHFRTCPKAKLN